MQLDTNKHSAEEIVKKLEKIGYIKNLGGTYYFKNNNVFFDTITHECEMIAIFIDSKTFDISFDGDFRYKETLLSEIRDLL